MKSSPNQLLTRLCFRWRWNPASSCQKIVQSIASWYHLAHQPWHLTLSRLQLSAWRPFAAARAASRSAEQQGRNKTSLWNFFLQFSELVAILSYKQKAVNIIVVNQFWGSAQFYSKSFHKKFIYETNQTGLLCLFTYLANWRHKTIHWFT